MCTILRLMLVVGLSAAYSLLPTARAWGSTPADITKTAQSLADGAGAEAAYGAKGGVTHCSEFVRALVEKVLKESRADLAGQIKNQYDALSANTNDWKALGFANDQAGVFERAQSLANAGTIVIVAWKNPSPTATDTGHIAVIVPGALEQSTNWKMKVPAIAQAGRLNPRGQPAEVGKSVFSSLKLSWGFTPTQGITGMELFQYLK